MDEIELNAAAGADIVLFDDIEMVGSEKEGFVPKKSYYTYVKKENSSLVADAFRKANFVFREAPRLKGSLGNAFDGYVVDGKYWPDGKEGVRIVAIQNRTETYAVIKKMFPQGLDFDDSGVFHLRNKNTIQ